MEKRSQNEQPRKSDTPQLFSKSPVEFSRLQVPEIALPKGGGALKGIEEKFQANPATGNANFSIPLPTSPGRSGFGPALTLSYDSGAGNGLFGLGWSLSAPSIVRKTDKGLPRYLDHEESDEFQFSGVEDLVPVTGSDRVEGSYKVRRYSPRVEGSFHRIERWTDTASHQIHWVVTSRDNVRTVYGDTSETRIAHPDYPTRVYRWLEHFSHDTLGNVIVYEYKAEDLANVLACLSERNRQSDVAHCTNLHLKRVWYGNSAPYNGNALPSEYLFQTVFDYGEHDLDIPTVQETESWICRSDAFSSYRSGFDIRTRRLCRRVLHFHNFAELGTAPCLVKSLELTYTSNDSGFAQLASASQSGHIRKADGSYESKSLPAMQFTYSAHQWSQAVHELDKESLANLPEGLGGVYQFTDLYGEGLSGILTDQGQAWYYKRNLGGGHFAAAVSVAPKPTIGSASAIQDLEGNNEKYLVDYAQAQGFAKLGSPDDLDQSGQWMSYQNFESLPKLDWQSRSLKFVDLDGDGRADILVDDESAFLYYKSEGRHGFALAGKVAKDLDEEHGPRVVFADAEQTLFLADMVGDGLTDIVRVRNGEICYWPNLGHGCFGAMVRMDGSPWLDSPDQFNPAFIHLADIDGSGPADLLYLGGGRVRAWLNRSGNGWGLPTELDVLPKIDRESRVQVLDFLGQGTACVVWSSPLPSYQNSPLRYVDLMGGQKPHLMISYSNGHGKNVQLEYTPSTRYYLEDQALATPWVTKLPFVVHCLSAVETQDKVSGHTYRSTYSYHHGYYDHAEREFRGFGRVDQTDSDLYSDPDTDQLPVLTRTWFHVGATLQGKKILDHYAQEYNAAYLGGTLPEPELPLNLSWAERVEAIRACKGIALRQEIYELDADGKLTDARPYQVIQKNCKIILKQARGTHKHAVFLVEDSESLTAHFEKNAADPRIQHSLVLETNDYGQPRWTAAVVYSRRIGTRPDNVPLEAWNEQKKSHAVVSHTEYTQLIDDANGYRLPSPWRACGFELKGLNMNSQLERGALRTAVLKATELPFESDSVPSTPSLRLVEQTETLYRSDDATTMLAAGVQGKKGLVWQSYALSWTNSLLDYVYGTKSTVAMLTEGGYVQRNLALAETTSQAWWAASGLHLYSASPADHFFQPSGIQDSFGKQTAIGYDSYDLLLTSVTDALGNVVSAQNNYRTLSPEIMTDPNGNRTAAETDALGIVIKMAVMGKVGAGEGDTLADPTSRMEYGFATFNATTGHVIQPSWVRSYSRETHANANTRWLQKVEYSDGHGRVQLTKAQAEPGTDQQPRWVGTGRTVLNNKGNPVKQYEPYFSSNSNWESEPEIVETGVTPVLYYDALSRLIRTDFPDGTYSKVEFTPWMQKSYDQNDTVRLPVENSDDILSDWYASRGAPLKTDPEPTDTETRAAWLSAQHANTPTLSHLDSLGRAISTQAHMGFDANNDPILVSTFVDLDIEGNEKRITDARNNKVMEYRYGIHGEKGYTKSMDAGERWMMLTVDGNPLYTWDSRNHRLRMEFDALRRPTKQWLSENGATEILVSFTEYGELATSSTDKNLRGKPWKAYDQSGLTENVQFDFKGNLLASTRQFVTAYSAVVDWNVSDLNALLNPETFTTTTAFDAFNRATSIITPSTGRIGQSEIVPQYNEASLLEKVMVKPFGSTIASTYVSNIDYNAKGQREKIVYGNGASTSYAYDPNSFRLTRLLTKRNSGTEILQDLNYTYDPVGNITRISDDAQQTVYFNGAVVNPTQNFQYDAQYRLLKATGREHVGNGSETETTSGLYPNAQSPMPSDSNALRNYTRTWEYDGVGNILSLIHNANNGNWTREYNYATTSNQLNSTSVGQTTLSYTHNEHGSMTMMPHLSAMDWDYAERLRHVQKGNDHAYYTYDGSGQRVRKVVVKGGITEERLYLGGFEIFRKRVGNDLDFERATLHVMDDKKRIALVEVKTWENGAVVTLSAPVIRYQLDNHLGSASLELDETAAVVSYEEYYPYGDTCYQAGRSASEVSQKRYRYTGKEKDEDSGLYYHGARYYACWLGRWTAADPIGVGDGVNLYMYVRGNPVRLHDPSGNVTENPANIIDDLPGAKVTAPGEVTLPGVDINVGEASLGGQSGSASGSFDSSLEPNPSNDMNSSVQLDECNYNCEKSYTDAVKELTAIVKSIGKNDLTDKQNRVLGKVPYPRVYLTLADDAYQRGRDYLIDPRNRAQVDSFAQLRMETKRDPEHNEFYITGHAGKNSNLKPKIGVISDDGQKSVDPKYDPNDKIVFHSHAGENPLSFGAIYDGETETLTGRGGDLGHSIGDEKNSPKEVFTITPSGDIYYTTPELAMFGIINSPTSFITSSDGTGKFGQVYLGNIRDYRRGK